MPVNNNQINLNGQNIDQLHRWDVRDFGWRTNWNNKFNEQWIKDHDLTKSPKNLEELALEGLDTSDSEHHETGWLKNIDRLIDMLPLEFNPLGYQLLDIGCGDGISTIYIADNFSFSSYTGIDFSRELIKTAKLNIPMGLYLNNIFLNLLFFISNFINLYFFDFLNSFTL